MNKTVETIVTHPIATILVVTCITRGITAIISAVKGTPVSPVINITQMAKDTCEGAEKA